MCEAFRMLSSETLFSKVGHGDIDLETIGPIANLTCILWCYTCIPNNVQICEAFHKLSSRNHLSSLVHGDFDLDPTSPNVKRDMYLVVLHMCTKG